MWTCNYMFDNIMQCQHMDPIYKLKWPLTIMINGWCHEMSTNEIHSHMDHSWKWPLNIIISRFITKVVNVHSVHTC